ncbi:MAG: hypothetical protein CMJ80_00505 [Planctomycetaceae bacterium]|nr:hypothetical protein [Planctomycetaceae bacterium]
MRTQRTHDKIYLNESSYNEPKRLHKFICQVSIEKVDENEKLNLCDFGCGAGDFLYYVRSRLPKSNLMGIDVLPELIDKGCTNLPSVNFQLGNVLDSTLRSSNEFDKVFLTGVHMIFDEFETCFSNLIDWTKPGGSVCITGMFNPYPVDVIIKYKHSVDYDNDMYEDGWNIFSQQSVIHYLKKKPKVSSFAFHEFKIDLDLPKQEDYIRSWTFPTFSGDRLITNGLCILQPIYLLEIKL